jgi:hypothetical protein
VPDAAWVSKEEEEGMGWSELPSEETRTVMSFPGKASVLGLVLLCETPCPHYGDANSS